MSYHPNPTITEHPNPYHDIVLASQDFWAGYTGESKYPPPPSYRMVKGKMRLGRYMDPYGCQGHMRSARDRWTKWYTGFLISIGVGVAFSEVDWVFFLVALPILAVWYFAVKMHYRRQYDLYYRVMEEIISTRQPKWVPYDKDRLNLLKTEPLAVWP